jgi:hypothetical protein
MSHFEADITGYRSTAFGYEAQDWTPESRKRFETVELPDLRLHENWGYLFSSNQSCDARLFMFHGVRPVSEAGKASIYRFDFEWDFDPVKLKEFTSAVLGIVECVCGTAGYVLCPDEGDYAAPAYDKMFAWAMRYWGAEAQDLDASADHALKGFPCISWLTVIGPVLREKSPDSMDRACALANTAFESNGSMVIQAEERPRLIDRNRSETLGNYPAVADALFPFQLKIHTPFGGDLWDEDNTIRYLRRFTHPDEV